MGIYKHCNDSVQHRVVNAGVHRNKAAEHLCICRVHDGVHSEACHIALPDNLETRMNTGLSGIWTRSRPDVAAMARFL